MVVGAYEERITRLWTGIGVNRGNLEGSDSVCHEIEAVTANRYGGHRTFPRAIPRGS
jgi:hypothetical protein